MDRFLEIDEDIGRIFICSRRPPGRRELECVRVFDCADLEATGSSMSIVVVNTVGLTSRQLRHVPRLANLAAAQWSRPLGEVTPAVTCSAQASMLTGKLPQEHGVVGNGWLFRDTREVRFWQQSNALIQAEPLYVTARKRAAERGRPFRCAKLFWWFNQGAAVDISVTPKPHYGADGNKAFDILAYPDGLGESLIAKLGSFPFQTFWGPMAGLPCSRWIGQCAAEVLRHPSGPPDLTLVYVPHFDYETQRLGPSRCDWAKLGYELDTACGPILDAANGVGAQLWIVNECGHVDVSRPVLINRVLTEAGFLSARRGPFGRQLDTFASRAFAVCDHQLAHIYVRDASDRPRVREIVARLDGVASVFEAAERGAIGLDHKRSGDLVLLAKPDTWFAYPFWLDDREAPDYARTVDIHRKPGYDPCELFFDPRLAFPKLRAMRRLLQKKLGLRTLFDVVPLDASLVKGSHGLPAAAPEDKPVLIGAGSAPAAEIVSQTAVRDLLLAAVS
jgi:predicted AlkP superfamily pyrophosphatase or phosphodiesterase